MNLRVRVIKKQLVRPAVTTLLFKPNDIRRFMMLMTLFMRVAVKIIAGQGTHGNRIVISKGMQVASDVLKIRPLSVVIIRITAIYSHGFTKNPGVIRGQKTGGSIPFRAIKI